MKYPLQVITELLLLSQGTLVLTGARILFSLLLVAVQAYVLRAMLRIIRALEVGDKKQKLLITATVVFLVIVNLPLAFLIVESVFFPRELLLYAPPAE